MIKKKQTKTQKYRRLLERLEKEFFGGNFEDFSCGNTMGLYVRNPYACVRIFNQFSRIKESK